MAKFCGNCGTQNEDAANVCGNCGTSFEVPAAPVAPEVPVAPAKKPLNAKLLAIILGAVAVVVAIVVTVVLLLGGGAEGTAKKFLEAYFNGKGETVYALMSEYAKDESDIDEDEFVERIEEFADMMLENAEEKYGDNIKYTVTVTDSEKMDDNDLEDLFGDDYEDIMEDNDITEAVLVEVEVEVEGDDDSDSDEAEVCVVKENGQWKVFRMSL